MPQVVQVSVENHLSYQEPERSQTKCKKRWPIDATVKIAEILEFDDKYVKIAIIKMLKQLQAQMKKKKKSQERSKRYKGEANENYRSEKYNN